MGNGTGLALANRKIRFNVVDKSGKKMPKILPIQLWTFQKIVRISLYNPQ